MPAAAPARRVVRNRGADLRSFSTNPTGRPQVPGLEMRREPIFERVDQTVDVAAKSMAADTASKPTITRASGSTVTDRPFRSNSQSTNAPPENLSGCIDDPADRPASAGHYAQDRPARRRGPPVEHAVRSGSRSYPAPDARHNVCRHRSRATCVRRRHALVVLVSSGMPNCCSRDRIVSLTQDGDRPRRLRSRGSPHCRVCIGPRPGSNCYGLRPRIRSPRRNSMPLG